VEVAVLARAMTVYIRAHKNNTNPVKGLLYTFRVSGPDVTALAAKLMIKVIVYQGKDTNAATNAAAASKFKDWSEFLVACEVSGPNLEAYRKLFEDKGMNVEEAATLTEDKLRDIGFKLGPAKKIHGCIQKLFA
jgi:hypothetical protein